ncbi:MAG: MBL fold metallo-hydrolase [Acidobacteria bacterium]|nr:MBL fold metallo-hydrolase [Acidobacteriota bacterium]
MRTPASILCLCLAAIPSAAHTRPAQPPAKTHRMERVAENVYCISGEGGNVGLVVTDKFAVLIDAQFDHTLPGLRDAIRSVTSKPIKYLINTHLHGDHTGGNRGMEGQGVAIVAHANVRKRLAEEQRGNPTEPQGGLPALTFGETDPQVKAQLNLFLGGTELQLLHYRAGHSDGDLLVSLPSAHVLHMGDLFLNGLLPFIDLPTGGSLAGLLENTEWVLSWLPAEAKVIPGHGPVASKADLLRYRDFLKAAQAHVQTHPGMTGAELSARFDRKAWPQFQELGKYLTWEGFFTMATGRMPVWD